MTRLTQRLACIAALLPVCVVPAAFGQAASATGALAGVSIRSFSPAAYQADRQNWALVADNRGILYFGNTAGVLEFDGTRWRLIKLPDGRGAFALGKAADGRILVGSEGEVGWLAPDPSGTMVYVSKADDLPEAFRNGGEPVIQILDAPSGRVFVSDHWLFLKPANGAMTVLRSGDHFMHAAWFQDTLYVVDSGRGLMRLNGGALQGVPGGADLRALTMLPTSAGLLIPSYVNGMVLYSPGAANPWQPLHLNGWNVEDNVGVTSAIGLTDNLVALGTAKHGVALIDIHGGGLQRLDVDAGLPDQHVYNLDYDHNGNLWLALANGVSLATLSLPKDSSAAPFRALVRNVISTKDDRLLFGGTFFDAPGGVQQLTQGRNQLPEFHYKINAFRFAYSANGLGATGQMQFQTFVLGVDPDWSSWSDRTEREFTQLAPGRWTFRVRARKPNGEVSEEGSYEILIHQAWYDTWWFTACEFLFVMGLVLLPGHTPHKKLQDTLTTFAAIVPCVYVGNWVGSMISHYLTSEVALINVLVSSLLALAIDPIQTRLKRLVQYRNERHARRRSLKAEHKRMLKEHLVMEKIHEEEARVHAKEEEEFAKEEQEFAKEEREFAEEEKQYKEQFERERLEREQKHKDHEHTDAEKPNEPSHD